MTAMDATRALLRVPPARIVEMAGILEGYDDLGVMRTLDATRGLVEVWISPGAEGEFEALLAALAREGLSWERADGEVP